MYKLIFQLSELTPTLCPVFDCVTGVMVLLWGSELVS